MNGTDLQKENLRLQARLEELEKALSDIDDLKSAKLERDELVRRERVSRGEAEAARAELAANRAKTDAAIKALAESEQRYRMMGEAVPFGVWWCNAKGEAEYVSPSFLELLDMTLEEQGGFGWTKRLVPEDVEPFFEKWNHCVATGEPWDYEHRIIDRYGDIHTVLTRGLPVHDEVGEFKAWVGVNLDITARKQMEVELKQAKEELEKALTIKDQFVANISHELRTPLALILEPVRKMLAAGNLQDDERRDLEVVERNARTLLRHVNDLLDLSELPHFCGDEVKQFTVFGLDSTSNRAEDRREWGQPRLVGGGPERLSGLN